MKSYIYNAVLVYVCLGFTTSAVVADVSDAQLRIHVELTTEQGDNGVYREGDGMTFLVSIDQDAYLLFLYEDVNKNVLQLLPNKLSGDGFYMADIFIEIPNEGDAFSLKAGPPFGKETFWMFASTDAFPDLKGEVFSNGLKLVDYSVSEVQGRLKRHAEQNGTAYGEDKITVQVLPKDD